MSSHLSVAGAILQLLGRHGITRTFGIPGVHNLPFWDADSDEAPRIIGAAQHMGRIAQRIKQGIAPRPRARCAPSCCLRAR